MSVSTATEGLKSGARADVPRRWQVVLIVLAFGIPAFLLGKVFWPDPVGAATPPPSVLPVFIAISVLEALLFGVGIAFIVYGRQWLTFGGSKLEMAAFVAVAWSLVSWWPHDNFHRVTHDWTGLAMIEVGFHLTLIVSILLIAAYFLRNLQARSKQP